MSKSKIIALSIVFIVTMFPGLLLLWLGIFGLVFNMGVVFVSVCLFVIGLFALGAIVDLME